MTIIAANLKEVRNRIAAAAARSGRDPAAIRLVAVSKTAPAEAVREAFEAGQTAFGENYAQEMAAKAAALSDLPIEWHFIGHLQKNKAKVVAPIAAWVESVDSIELAEAMGRRATKTIPCLIEVNVGGEASKSGVAPEGVAGLARGIMALPRLSLEGLMVIPPFDPDPEQSKPYFRKLRAMLDALNEELNPERPLHVLSMGMSHDFEVAIEEGATIVRIGTAIFGPRP